MNEVQGEQVEVLANDMPRILIGIAILTWDHRFAVSFLKFWTELMTYNVVGRKFQISYFFAYRRPVQMAQEEIAQHAMNCNCTHVLYIDDDIFDLKVEDLLKLLDADKDVVGGIMYTGGFPYSMCAFRRYDTSKKVAEMPTIYGMARLYEIPPEQRVGVVECDLIPFGFTLMKLSVFNKIPKPWFQCDCVAPTDSYFCDAIMDAGIKPHAHFDVWLNHKGVHKDNVMLHLQIGQIENQRHVGNEMMLISPEEGKRLEMLMGQKLVESERKIKEMAVRKQNFYLKQEGEAVGQLVHNGTPDSTPPKEKQDG